jgi:hypothetical protein
MDRLPVTVNLDGYRGDSWSQQFRFKDGETPHDLTNATITSAVRDRNGTVTQLTVTIADQVASPGQLTIATPTTLATGYYDYDVQVTEGTIVTTWVKGRLAVGQDVTP